MQDVVSRVIRSFHDVSASAWDRLVAHDDNPFLEHAFLTLLEDSGSLKPSWQPRVVVAERAGALVGAVPANSSLTGSSPRPPSALASPTIRS